MAHISPKLLADSAVSFVCRQTASQSGDVRRLLQSTAAAVHDLLCTLEDEDKADDNSDDDDGDDDKGDARPRKKRRRKGEPSSSSSGEGSPLLRDVSSGIVTIQHMSAVVSKVFQDRFQEFLKDPSMPPLLFLIVCAIVVEHDRLERSGGDASLVPPPESGKGCGKMIVSSSSLSSKDRIGTGGVPFERVMGSTSVFVRQLRKPLKIPEDFSPSKGTVTLLLDALRQVGMIELSCGPEMLTVPSVLELAGEAWGGGGVRVVLLQPASVLSVLCKLHPTYGQFVSEFFRPS